MYKRIQIENFRGIPSLELKNLGRFNLFVGKNNCGKTSLLESIFLLTGPTNVDLPVLINNFRGYRVANEYSWSVIFHKLDTASPIKIQGEISEPQEKRSLTITGALTGTKTKTKTNTSSSSSQFTIKESQTLRPGKINGLTMEYFLQKNTGKNEQKFISEIKWTGEKFERSFSSPHTDSLKGVYINPRTIFEDTAERFSEIQIKKQEAIILKILQKVEPDLIDISIGAENILYCDVGFPQRLPINVVGEGLNKLLAIILAIYDASGGIVLIDEIENGLHYSAQQTLWEAIIEAADTFAVQVFASTHSYENVRAYHAAYGKYGEGKDNLRIYRIEKEKNSLQIIDFNYEMLTTVLESDWEIR